jgi:cell division septation protein DedD
MREEIAKRRETFDLSLDGRQIASIAVGALVILGVVFVLGLNVGRQMALRAAEVEGGVDALAALDRAPSPPAEPVREESLTFHDRLTRERAAPPPEPREAPAPAAPAADPAPAPSPAPPPEAAAPAIPAPAAGAFSVQVGASKDKAEAERIAGRFRSYGPRVEEAEIAGKGTWFRVRVGSFPTREAAERYREDLSRETGVKGYVASNP